LLVLESFLRYLLPCCDIDEALIERRTVMEMMKRYGWTTNAAFLVMLLLVLATFMVLLVPAQAYAACCGHKITERYYSDASYTTLVGTCVDNECAGTYTCTGQQTAYETATQVCCEICQA
jgi:hypothetical protein